MERLEELDAHDFAVRIERALRSQDWWDSSCQIEPPDSEDRPDNFGVSQDGELLFIVRVDRL